ncbi:MAG: hypothetical protein KTR15_05235 [Phycisphaeraceae bacterium]|nr:hypothetical protein [Phycisphaeraceae bacterium]
MKHSYFRLAAVIVFAGMFAPVTSAQSADEDKTVEERREEARVERLWNLNWRSLAPYFLEHEGQYVCVPGYSRSQPSSVGQSISEYRKESTWTQEYEDERGKDVSRKLVKPEEEAFAAVALIPEVEVGQYGYIHSGEIDDIVDDKTVELSDIWLVDSEAIREEKREMKEDLWGKVLEDIEDAIRDRRNSKRSRRDRRMAESDAIDWGFKVREEAAGRQRDSVFSRYSWVIKGFATGKLKEGARWPSEYAKEPGLQLIIVEIDGRTVTAVPAAMLRKGITELQFIDYLQSREIKKADFVEIVSEAKRDHRSGYLPHVLAKITGKESPAPAEDVNNEVELAE